MDAVSLDDRLLSSRFQFDTNGDGMISTAELREAMKKLLGQQVKTSQGDLLSSHSVPASFY